MPSALLKVALPTGANNKTADVLACSIDAKWWRGQYNGGPIVGNGDEYVQNATLAQDELPKGRTWRSVELDIEWLHALTPTSGDHNGTLLSVILESMFLPNATNLGQVLSVLGGTLTDVPVYATVPDNSRLDYRNYLLQSVQTVSAALIADGMSRVGLDRMDLDFPPLSLRQGELSPEGVTVDYPATQGWLAGTYKASKPSSGPSIPIEFSVQLTGLAFRADSNSYKVALAVLFLHAACALAHITYVLKNRVFCGTWDSFLGLLILAARSNNKYLDGLETSSNASNHNQKDDEDTDMFPNTGSGITRYRTMQTGVRIRAREVCDTKAPKAEADSPEAGSEQVEILFGMDEPKLTSAGYKKLEEGKTYA